MKAIKLTDIRIDGGTQTRAEISNATVEEYAEAVLEGVKFPPVDLFFDGVENWLADGFHRYHAHKRAKVTDIAATIHNGSKDDALVFALGANRANGLRRTNEDKRKCVGIAVERWPERSDRWIAEVCGVSNHMVADCRPDQLGDSPTSTSRTGKDGKKRRAPAQETVLPHLYDAEEPPSPAEPAPTKKTRGSYTDWQAFRQLCIEIASLCDSLEALQVDAAHAIQARDLSARLGKKLTHISNTQ